MNLEKIGVKLAYLLRHCTQPLYVDLDGGWADVAVIIDALAKRFPGMNREIMDAVVAADNKGRFSYDETGSRIRANQGHSISGIQVEMRQVTPPEFLYHGTSVRFLQPILAEGLKPMSRQFVHLSSDYETAVKVGRRHGGRTVVLLVKARQMERDGHLFWLSANHVWQVKSVPAAYLAPATEQIET